MPDIPYNEPAQIRAGDSTSWLRTVADYPPADGWTLKYAFRNATAKFTVTATTSGTDYLVSITRATSKTYPPGRYDWVCYVTKGAAPSDEQHTVATGSIPVLPDLSADVVYDNRSDARKIYDDLITAYKSYISSGGTIQSFSIAGKSVVYKDQANMIKDIEHWARKVQEEDDAAMVAKGFANPRRVGVRFVKL